MIKSFLFPKSRACHWGGDSSSDSGGGWTGDAGGGYNAGDFGGDYGGNFGDAFSGADYSGSFDSGGGFNGGGFDNSDSFTGGGVNYGDAGVGFSGFGSGNFGGGFNTSDSAGGFGGSFGGSDNIGGDQGGYSGYADNSVGSFGPQGGWADALSADPNAGPGIMGYMSGMMDAPGWGPGDYGAYGGFGGAYGPGSGPFGGQPSGNQGGPFSAPEMESNTPGQPGQYGTYALGTPDVNQATIHGPAQDYSQDLSDLSGLGRGDLGATQALGRGPDFNQVFDAVNNSTLGNILGPGNLGVGFPIGAPSFFGSGQEGDPGGRGFAPAGPDPGGPQGTPDFGARGAQSEVGDYRGSQMDYDVQGLPGNKGTAEDQGYYQGFNNFAPQDIGYQYGKDQSQFAPDLSAQLGLNDIGRGITNYDLGDILSGPAFGWGPASTLGGIMGPQTLSGTGPGHFGPFADTGKGDLQANSFDSRFNGDFSPSEGNFNMAEAQAHGEQGRAGTLNLEGGYPISPGAEQYALTAGDLRSDSPGLLGGGLGYDLGTEFGNGRGPQNTSIVSMDRNISANPFMDPNFGYPGRDSFDSRFGGPYAPAVAWTSDMTLSDKGDNSRDSFDSRFGEWGPSNPNMVQQGRDQEANLLSPELMGPPSQFQLSERGPSNQNMGLPNNNPTSDEFYGPGRGENQNIGRPNSYPSLERGAPPLQVTVPGRTPSSQQTPSSRGGSFQGFQTTQQGGRSQMDALLAQARTAPTQAARIAALDALNGLISATYGRGPNNSVGRGPYNGDPDPNIAAMLRMGR